MKEEGGKLGRGIAGITSRTELLLARQPHAILDEARALRALVNAPIADEVLRKRRYDILAGLRFENPRPSPIHRPSTPGWGATCTSHPEARAHAAPHLAQRL